MLAGDSRTMDEKQFIVQEIQRVARSIAPATLTTDAFLKSSSVKVGKIRYYFGTWNEALAAAGLPPNAKGIRVSGYGKATDDELLAEIGRIWNENGRRPTEDMMNSKGRFSVTPYRKRWGTMRVAVELYVQRFGEPCGAPKPATKELEPAKKGRGVFVIPDTHRPASRSVSRAPILYGEPLDFRGLRYAPVNEQGVVYLFGMVSRELEFLVESIRTAFPDCEGKRCLNPTGTKWQHVHIEFEYRSSNFEEHGHDRENCDLIVCWTHDWQDCPIEVLELKDAIARLPRQ